MTLDQPDTDTTELLVEGLQYIRFENDDNQCVAILMDDDKYEILKGYGSSKLEALNDLHQTLL